MIMDVGYGEIVLVVYFWDIMIVIVLLNDLVMNVISGLICGMVEVGNCVCVMIGLISVEISVYLFDWFGFSIG